MSDTKSPNKIILWTLFFTSTILTAIGYYIIEKNIDAGSGFYFYSYLSVTVVPMSISIMYLLKKLNKPILNENITEKISSLTFGIYLIHPIFLSIIRIKFNYEIHYSSLLTIPFLSLLVFMISLISALVISKIPYVKSII